MYLVIIHMHRYGHNYQLILFETQDVSDRIEKEDPETSLLLQELEKDSIRVVRGDWNAHLGTELRGGKEVS